MRKMMFQIAFLAALCVCLTATAIAAPGDDTDFFSDPVYEAGDFTDLVNATKAMIRQYEDIDSLDGGAYSSARLIVSANAEPPRLSQYSPAQVVVDTNHNYLIQFFTSEEAEAYAEFLEKGNYSTVNYVQPDMLLQAIGANPVSPGGNSWGVSATKADAYAQDLIERGVSASVTVAVVDTGVDSSHPFLAGRVLSGYDMVDNDATPQDGNGHGTHVSGTVGDCTPGLDVKILPVRVLDNSGSGYDSVVGLGIEYAADNGANVINLSLGGPGHSSNIDSKISYAISKNVTVVVAAGNESDDTKNHCPAHNVDCITVAAVDINKKQAYFSNYGDAVDIAAPGVDIKSCIPGGKYASWDGTSMATPHVAAAAAMLLYENQSLKPAEVEETLRSAAQDLGDPGWDRKYGAGFLSLEAFLDGPETPPSPPEDDDIIFEDVPKDAYFYDAVYWATKQRITEGATKKTFSPYNPCTTAQILTFMWRADGSPQPESDNVDNTGGYFDNALEWAFGKGMLEENRVSSISVTASGSACTRAEAMTYMWHYEGRPKSGNNPFSDVPNNTYYAQAVCWAVQEGITKGTTETTFSPNNSCTRAQIVTFLYRYYVERNA